MSGRYYRRRYNNWYRGGRYYGRNRRYYRSSTVRRAVGNMRAAKQQADQSTFTFNIPTSIEAANYPSADPFNPTDASKTVNYGVYPLNIYEQLRKSDFYQSYAAMYDEFKVDRIKVKLLPTEFTYTATTGINGQDGRYKNITVYTAWDRTGLSKDQLILLASHMNEDSDEIGVVTTNAQTGIINDDGDGLFCIVGNDITTYSSAESRVINPGTNTSIVRWLNPKTMDEKSQWVSTSALKQWYKGYRSGKFYGIPTGKKSDNFLLTNHADVEISNEIIPPDPTIDNDTAIGRSLLKVVSAANKDNPCYLLEDTGFKFKPTLLVGIYPQSTNANTCIFNIETEVVCTFRGLRKANIVSALNNNNNGGDNPPGYNPDIINNQLITTFGTTTAPDDFAFGSVNVRPVPHQHLEHTFNTTDLTQEAIENAIDDAPGLDVHTVGINQEQIVGDGAPINESTLTNINWGKYRLRTLGLHQIATADNSNNWVVPALMEVSISLIQNQVIDHTGTYRIVQRTINGETGLVIEEYIPEPEPEEEINNNVRAMIIDEEEYNENNNNNGQIVLRGQNNVRGDDPTPSPAGEAIEGTFEININTSTSTTTKTITIDSIGNNQSTTYNASNDNVDGFSSVTIINNTSSAVPLENKTVEYNLGANIPNTITPSSGYYGINSVTFSPITSGNVCSNLLQGVTLNNILARTNTEVGIPYSLSTAVYNNMYFTIDNYNLTYEGLLSIINGSGYVQANDNITAYLWSEAPFISNGFVVRYRGSNMTVDVSNDAINWITSKTFNGSYTDTREYTYSAPEISASWKFYRFTISGGICIIEKFISNFCKDVSYNVSNVNLENNKQITITANNTTSNFYLNPTNGYDGFSNAIIQVIPPTLPTLQTKTITSPGTYYPDSGYYGFSSVIVNTSSSNTPKQIYKLKLGDDGKMLTISSFTSILTGGHFTVTPRSYQDSETGNTKYGFWVASYIIKNNKCWICYTGVQRNNSSTVTLTNNSSATSYYYIHNVGEEVFYDANCTIAYDNNNNIMFTTRGPSTDHYSYNETTNLDLYIYDPSNPDYNEPPSFSLDYFTF